MFDPARTEVIRVPGVIPRDCIETMLDRVPVRREWDFHLLLLGVAVFARHDAIALLRLEGVRREDGDGAVHGEHGSLCVGHARKFLEFARVTRLEQLRLTDK